jgi:hypothetical protein
MYEVRFAAEALKDLLRTVGEGLRNGVFARDPEKVRKVRAALERFQSEIREILAESPSGQEAAGTGEAGSSGPGGEEYV